MSDLVSNENVVDRVVYVIAIWEVIERRHVAAYRIAERWRAEAVIEVANALVPAFYTFLEVPRDDTDLIEAMLLEIEPIPDEIAIRMYGAIAEMLVNRILREKKKRGGNDVH